MTGYGEARRQSGGWKIHCEVRAVNNRYFKLTTRTSDGYASLEGSIDKVVREFISRGTITVTLRVSHETSPDRFELNRETLQSYWEQLHRIAEATHAPTPADLGCLLQLPGAVTEPDNEADPQAAWPDVSDVLKESLRKLQEFRQSEGESMRVELAAQCSGVSEQLARVAVRAPGVVKDYRERLTERIRGLLTEHSVQISDSDLLREMGLFADRCDITEEITRLRSHLEQFESVMSQDESQGRKLEFLSQEMFRETNTIGSKANDVEIAHCVVEMKANVEKVREILQNVE
jgi:uncharacterized protein (TIGR00255 family)